MPPQGRIEVRDNYCKGCEICVDACPQGVLALASERLNIKGYHPVELIEQGCTGCGICAIVCPEAAIIVYREVKSRSQ
jgi:2-oxoglutarate ferredoxin oxidoreductase subunit delta